MCGAYCSYKAQTYHDLRMHVCVRICEFFVSFMEMFDLKPVYVQTWCCHFLKRRFQKCLFFQILNWYFRL